MSGEPYALRGARTVRSGEVGKQIDCAPPLTLLSGRIGFPEVMAFIGKNDNALRIQIWTNLIS